VGSTASTPFLSPSPPPFNTSFFLPFWRTANTKSLFDGYSSSTTLSLIFLPPPVLQHSEKEGFQTGGRMSFLPPSSLTPGTNSIARRTLCRSIGTDLPFGHFPFFFSCGSWETKFGWMAHLQFFLRSSSFPSPFSPCNTKNDGWIWLLPCSSFPVFFFALFPLGFRRSAADTFGNGGRNYSEFPPFLLPPVTVSLFPLPSLVLWRHQYDEVFFAAKAANSAGGVSPPFLSFFPVPPSPTSTGAQSSTSDRARPATFFPF